MKNFLLLFIVGLFAVFTVSEAQVSFPKTYKNDYTSVEIAFDSSYTNVDDTTYSLLVPSEISTITVYGKVDSLSASDSVRFLYYVSPTGDAGTWSLIDSTSYATAEGTILRKTITSYDAFIRFIRDLKGTTVSTFTRLYLGGKK